MSRKYVTFAPMPPVSGRKTKSWFVMSRENGDYLGEVKWHSPWRRYVFHPAAHTLYDDACLRHLATFCGAQTADLRATWRKPKEIHL